MAFTITAGMTFTTPAGTSRSPVATYTVDGLQEYQIAVPASSTDYVVNCAFPFATLKVFSVSGTAACTIQTNDGTSPDDTVSLTSTILMKAWTHDLKAGNLTANPFTANVETLYITSTTAQTLTIKVGYDSTPA